jgi:hypothetical protein
VAGKREFVHSLAGDRELSFNVIADRVKCVSAGFAALSISPLPPLSVVTPSKSFTTFGAFLGSTIRRMSPNVDFSLLLTALTRARSAGLLSLHVERQAFELRAQLLLDQLPVAAFYLRRATRSARRVAVAAHRALMAPQSAMIFRHTAGVLLLRGMCTSPITPVPAAAIEHRRAFRIRNRIAASHLRRESARADTDQATTAPGRSRDARLYVEVEAEDQWCAWIVAEWLAVRALVESVVSAAFEVDERCVVFLVEGQLVQVAHRCCDFRLAP